MVLEVIVQTVEDARAAAGGGADRLEIVRSIRDGGLTPPVSLVRAIAAETSLPLRVMVRENAGFDTSPGEPAVLRGAAAEFAALGVDGLVLGFARGGELYLDPLQQAIDRIPDVRVTFHRAFDALADPLNAIDRLAAVPPIDRLLTSGGDGSPADRCERLRQYVARAAGRLEIIAGGAMTEELFERLARTRCVREIHVGRAARERWDQEAPVSVDRVRRLRALMG
jgi:copper homeostasis protein